MWMDHYPFKFFCKFKEITERSLLRKKSKLSFYIILLKEKRNTKPIYFYYTYIYKCIEKDLEGSNSVTFGEWHEMKCHKMEITTFTHIFLYGLDHWLTVPVFCCGRANHPKPSAIKQQSLYSALRSYKLEIWIRHSRTGSFLLPRGRLWQWEVSDFICGTWAQVGPLLRIPTDALSVAQIPHRMETVLLRERKRKEASGEKIFQENQTKLCIFYAPVSEVT